MKKSPTAIVSALFALLATTAFAETPFKVLFDFGRTSGDRDHHFAERQPIDTFDVNGSASTGLSVVNAGYLNSQNKLTVWLVLNDTNPDILDTSPSTNVNDLVAGTNVVVRTRLQYLYAGANTVTNEAASAGILFGLTGTGSTRSGYLARVDRFNLAVNGTNNYAELHIDEFTNGVRGASLANASFVYGVNTSPHFLELRITSDGATTNVTLKSFADADIPDAASTTNINRLLDPAFDTATPEASVTVALPNYNPGFLALYAEDNSNMTPNNPANGVIRFSNFYAKSGILPPVVTVVATDDLASEDGASGTFEFTRAFPDVVTTNVALTVYYAISGTAANGADYPALSGEVTIPVGVSNVSLTVTPTDDSESELTETLTVSVLSSSNYFAELPYSATMTISDNDPTQVGVYASDTHAYERLPGCYAEFTLLRYGVTNTTPTVNVTYSGTAVSGVDYTADTSASFGSGEITKALTVTPIDNASYTGNKTVVATVVAGTGYTPAPANVATATIVDDEFPAETVLWSDNFDSSPDNSTNYTVTAATRDGPDDYTTNWFFDYVAAGIPGAPHGSSNYGLKVSANKSPDGTNRPAAVNLYPIGQTFSGNYALRFNLLLRFDFTDAEEAIFGINQSGTATNWYHGEYGGLIAGEGIWVRLRTGHPTGTGESVGIFAVTNAGDPVVLIASVPQSELTTVLHSSPFGQPGYGGSSVILGSMEWLDCELGQIDNVVTLKLNNTPIFQFTNSGGATSGDIFLGYNDGFQSLGSDDTYAVYENVRVVQFASTAPPVITAINLVGGNVQVDFTGSAGDTANHFLLLNASVVNGAYATNLSATITSLGGAAFRASTATSGLQQFYRIQRQ